jgi:predicted nucleic acid-binding protein
MSFVLDSSAALSWCFADERTPAAMELLDRTAEQGAVTTALWPLEVVNGLLTAERRGRVDPASRERLVGFLRNLPITLDGETAAQSWDATLRLAERFRLTLHDAAYLEASLRLALPLATLDLALREAGAQLGVELLGV